MIFRYSSFWSRLSECTDVAETKNISKKKKLVDLKVQMWQVILRGEE